MAKRWEFFTHSDGTRVRLHIDRLAPVSCVRPMYRAHCLTISNTHELRATLRAGRFTSLGSYPVYFATADSDTLCFGCVLANYRLVSQAIRTGFDNQWRVIGCDVNYESELYCAHCSNPIESAYGVFSHE